MKNDSNSRLVSHTIIRSKNRNDSTDMKMLWNKLFEHLPLDSAADQIAIKFHHDALPPVLLPGDAAKVVSSLFTLLWLFHLLWKISGNNTPELNINREVRLIRAQAIRVVLEDGILLQHGERVEIENQINNNRYSGLLFPQRKFASISRLRATSNRICSWCWACVRVPHWVVSFLG